MTKIFVTVYGEPSECHSVLVEFELIRKASKEWFNDEPDTYSVNFARVCNGQKLQVVPTDLKLDIETAIAEHIGVEQGLVTVECKIQNVHISREILKQIAA